MNKGKDICKELKAVRKQIAEENGIPLEIPECTYQGPCKGTCPRCDSEVRYLENALAERLRMGKMAKVAGIALALAAPTAVGAQNTKVPTGHECQTQDSVPARQSVPLQEPIVGKPAVMSAGLAVNPPQVVADSVRVTGTVVDGRTKEPLPFVNIIVKQEGKLVAGATTDFDGGFSIALEEGEYEFKVSSIGYASRSFPVKVPDGMPMKAIELEVNGALLEQMGILTEDDLVPLIDPTTSGIQSGSEVDGVKLRIQY